MLCSAPGKAAVFGYALTEKIAAREPSRQPGFDFDAFAEAWAAFEAART